MECNCDLRTKLVGDGCEVCNPKLAAEIAAENQQTDPLYDKAVQLARTQKRVGLSLLQRTFMIGYNRAARLLEAMERQGVLRLVPDTRGGHWQVNA